MSRPRRSGQFVTLLLLAFFMAGAIAFTLLFVRLGYTPGFLRLWLRDWTVAFVVALPTGLLVLPLARRIAGTFSR